MSGRPDSVREAELLRLLGPAGFMRLLEKRAGTRLYVPADAAGSDLVGELGGEVVGKLAESHARSYIPIPLAREFRARHYRAAGKPNAEIAGLLGITERGVERIFAAMPAPPCKGSADPRQLHLFD